MVSKSALLACSLTACAGYNVTDDNGFGRRFDGIGAISGGGATSRLLFDYVEPQRSEILDFLFLPNFGASLQILKVEVGADVDSTNGVEASHMRSEDDLSFNRGYEWWLMTEAKKRNPDILTYALPWGWPAWIGQNTTNPWTNITKPLDYMLTFARGARDVYNVTLDYMGCVSGYNSAGCLRVNGKPGSAQFWSHLSLPSPLPPFYYYAPCAASGTNSLGLLTTLCP